LKSCPQCHNQNIKQTSSTLSRILLSVYLFLIFLFFTGELAFFHVFLALIPIVIPYKNKCFNCNYKYFKKAPQSSKGSLIGDRIILIKYLLGIFPSIVTITILITFFPYTGLGRVVALPIIFFINTVAIIFVISVTRIMKSASKILIWITTLLLTVFITIYFFPQESGQSVYNQIFEEIKKITK